MAKEFLLIGILLIIILAICILSQWYITSSAADIHASLMPCTKAIEQEDWLQAESSFAEAKTKWQQTQKLWRILINHQDMKDVEMSFVDMEAILQQNDQAKAAQELETLLFFIKHIPENERVNIGNIL